MRMLYRTSPATVIEGTGPREAAQRIRLPGVPAEQVKDEASEDGAAKLAGDSRPAPSVTPSVQPTAHRQSSVHPGPRIL